MLGLRPRLKSRPSLLDLIQKKNIDQISASVKRAIPILKADVEPSHVPLPASPLIPPQRPQLPPPRITLHTGSDTEEETAKMTSVSFLSSRANASGIANGGVAESTEEARAEVQRR
jgi:V-type H+-transporting ATPase subunit A